MRNMKILALVAVLGLVSNVAFGGLIIDMRNVTESGGGSATIDPVNHIITVSSADVGQYLTFQVWATVSGGTTTNNLGFLQTYIKETNAVQGEVHGNMGGLASESGAITLDMFTSAFQGGTIPATFTNAVSGDTEFNVSANNYYARANNGTPVDATSGVEVGVFTFQITSLVSASATPTVLALVPRTTSTAGASFYLDATNYNGKATGAGGVYLFTAAASGGSWSCVTQVVPEPATLVMLAMGAFVLAAYPPPQEVT